MSVTDLKALRGLDGDIRGAMLCQIRDLWTHGSTALEGNTLTPGETKLVIEEGLTVSRKPLNDHQEVVGHARAIDLIYGSPDGEGTEVRRFDLSAIVGRTSIPSAREPSNLPHLDRRGESGLSGRLAEVPVECMHDA
jgi:hypothetical protein